jgi:hypothetical protein
MELRVYIMLLLLQMAARNGFVLLKKCNTTEKNYKGKECAIKDFILDCTQMTEDDESLHSVDSSDSTPTQ